MTDTASNNKRIAKNTLMLYIRMLLSMVVSLYTSRVVLNTLGVEDYGIYGVVGGVVSMFSFLNASMSGATSRFLTFEIGKGDFQRLKETFSSALIIHIGIAFVIILLAETVGLWFLVNKLVIPAERMEAAHWVYQLSVLSMAVSVTQVPYNASIISHEKMDIYAYVEILNVTLKLLIVYLLVIGNFDKLILYAVLTLAVSIIIAFIYRIYCIKHFAECHFYWSWNSEMLKTMLSFSGWDLYGNMSVMARQQGVNILLNLFFGPLMNAASAIASQVQGAIGAFASNVLTAAKPQIIKLYASKESEQMVSLIRDTIRINFFLLLIFTIPLLCEMDFVLKIWLGDVPDYTSIFCIYTLLFNFFANMSVVLVTGIHATGRIKRPSLINGSLYLMVVPLSYITFLLKSEALVPYVFNLLAVFCGMISNGYTLKLYVKEFSLYTYITKDLSLCIFVLLITFSLTYSLHYIISEGWIRLLLVINFSTIILLLIGYNMILSKSMKLKIKSCVKNKIRL